MGDQTEPAAGQSSERRGMVLLGGARIRAAYPVTQRMTDEAAREPLPARVSECMIEYPGVTPTQIMAALDLDVQYRAQLEYYCAVTRYSLFRGEEGCDLSADVQLKTVTWADVADWDIPVEDRPPATSTE